MHACDVTGKERRYDEEDEERAMGFLGEEVEKGEPPRFRDPKGRSFNNRQIKFSIWTSGKNQMNGRRK